MPSTESSTRTARDFALREQLTASSHSLSAPALLESLALSL
jgi:hypothetical protein